MVFQCTHMTQARTAAAAALTVDRWSRRSADRPAYRTCRPPVVYTEPFLGRPGKRESAGTFMISKS